MTTQKFNFTPQAAGSIMLAVQKGLLARAMNRSEEEQDISEIILGFELENTIDGLIVNNPPSIQIINDEGD